MEKEIRLSVRINQELKKKFWFVCSEKQQTPSKVIKWLMEEYADKYKQEHGL